MKILVAIILVYGIRGEERFSKPFGRLNDVITTRIMEILKERSSVQDQFPNRFITLRRAEKLPISHLDKKIEAYNTFKFMQDESFVLINPRDTQIMTYSERESATRHELTGLEKKILKLIKKLGIYDNFTTRVFKAIFSDEKQLKKLREKLEELGKEDMSSSSDSLWDFIIDLF